MRLYEKKKLGMNIEKCLINQALKKYLGLVKVIYQKFENKTGNNINR